MTGYDGERHREAEIGRPITTFLNPEPDLSVTNYADAVERAPPGNKGKDNILSMTRIRTKKKKRDAGQWSASATNLHWQPGRDSNAVAQRRRTADQARNARQRTKGDRHDLLPTGATEAYEVKFYDVSTFKKPFLIEPPSDGGRDDTDA